MKVETTYPTLSQAWTALEQIADPEIPVLSLVDLKIVRNVRVDGASVTVEMTPTFLGCPALDLMKAQIEEKLLSLGFEAVRVELKLSPPWSSDLLSEEAREKLRAYGVAPPEKLSGSLQETLARSPACPFCGSANTRMENPFGATLCRQLFFCDECRQPFERFKSL